jgi:hypothetical protein
MNTEIKNNDTIIIDINDPIDNCVWDNSIELILNEIGEKSYGYKTMHIKESLYKKKIYNYLMYSGIILGPLAGLISTIQNTLYPSTDNPILPIISVTISFISGIVIAINKFGKFEETANIHKTTANKYTSLENNIRCQLKLKKNMRVKPLEYNKWITQSYNDIYISSPMISNKIYNLYKKYAKKNKLYIPDEYEKIIILSENNLNTINNNIKNNNQLNTINIDNTQKVISKLIPTTQIIRNNTIRMLPSLNEYNDPRMRYEIKRMNN